MTHHPNPPTAPRPVVFVQQGEALASSRDVAQFFEKNHRDVLRAIDELIAAEPALGGLREIAQTPLRNFAQGSAPRFEESRYIEAQNGQSYRAFHMNRDAFTLLAMGFTGEKALKWKMRYIEAFNLMEAELRRRAEPQIETVAAAPELGESMKEKVWSLNAVREARILFGHGAARKMWREMGLPAAPSTDPALQDRDPLEDASAAANWEGALQHLLQWPVPLPEANGDSMERWIRAAAEQNGEWINRRDPREIRRALGACGLVVEAHHRPSLTIANNHPWLSACFLETAWAYGIWRRAFASAPGAEKIGPTRFGAARHLSRGVRLPLSLVFAP